MPTPHDLASRAAWPTVFFYRTWSDHPREAPGIIEHLYALKAAAGTDIASGVASTAKSGRGLFESDFDLFASAHSGLRRLRAFIEESVSEAVSRINGGKVAPERIRVEIAEGWFHITNDGGFHDAHVHGHCSWCGIYYLQAGDSASTADRAGNGVNRFYAPIGTGGAFHDYGNAYLSANRIDITPVDGQLLLFPSYLMHSALAYQGRRDRVVVAFNTRSSLAG